MNRLYHFTTANYAFDDLRNRRLKIAQLDDLNDPFELKSVNLCDPLHALAFDGTDNRGGFKAEMARRYGVLCFSEDKRRNRDRFPCVGRRSAPIAKHQFSGSEGKFGRVQYEEERFPFPDPPDQAFMWKLLSTKSVAWKYEKEWRVFLRLDEGIWNEGAGRVLHFADFGSELVLREVILVKQARILSTTYVYNAIRGYQEIVQVARMRLSCSRFELQPAAK